MNGRHHRDARDEALGRELDTLGVPDHGPRFWDQVDGRLQRDAYERDAVFAEALPDPALGRRLARLQLPEHGEDYWDEITDSLAFEAELRQRHGRRSLRRRWPKLVAAAAVAAAATFLVAAWFRLPASIGGAGRALAHVVLPPLQEGLTSAARIDDGVIVWTSRAGTSPATGEPDTSIFAYDLAARRLVAPVSTLASPKRLAAFGGGRVVWFDGRDGGSTLHVRDLRLGLDTTVEAAAVTNRDRHADTAALVARGQAAISGDTILWTDWTHGDGDILRYDLGTGLADALVRDPGRQEQPAIWGDMAVWVDGRNSLTEADGTVRDLDVYAADLRTDKEFPVCIAAGEQVHPSISGDVIVWQDGRDRTATAPGEWNIYAYDAGTQRESIVTDAAGPQTDPVISDDVVVWTDGPHADGRSAIMGCDLHTGRVFQISDDEGAYASPSISGRTVIWSARRGDGTQLAVYGATIAVSPRAITVTPLQ